MLLTLLLAVMQAGPPAVAGHALVYAGDQGLLLLNADGATGKRIWRLDGKQWSLVPGEHPQVHSLAAVAYDPDTRAILMHGGAIGHPSEGGGIDWKPDASTLRFDGKVWKTVATTGPAPRDHHAMVYDRARKRFVLYGGTDADPTGRTTWFDDTWEWDGERWVEIEGPGPKVSAHFGMAYDEKRERVVLAGGFGQRGSDARVWELDGKTWSPVAPGETGESSSPALRTSPRMAFHAKLGQVVLFGGETDRVHSSDTWAWNGKAWSKIADEGPPGRSVHALAYDEKRGVLVMYGGAGPGELDDLWELDGSKWSRIVTR